MSLYSLCFSPTGGTKKVSQALTSAWEETAILIDLTAPQAAEFAVTFNESDICVIAVPVFGGRVPAAAAERLSQLRGNQAAALLAVVYGNRAYEDALAELEDIAYRAGFRCAAAVAAVAEHSIIRRFAAGRPDVADRQQLTEYARQIRRTWQATGISRHVSLPGNRPYRPYSPLPMVPQANADCVRCGLCARKCPVQAIAPTAPQRTDPAVCISCMRCVSLCPRHARQVDPLLRESLTHKLEKVCAGRKSNELFVEF